MSCARGPAAQQAQAPVLRARPSGAASTGPSPSRVAQRRRQAPDMRFQRLRAHGPRSCACGPAALRAQAAVLPCGPAAPHAQAVLIAQPGGAARPLSCARAVCVRPAANQCACTGA